jgi:forespore regulator of the sigma-K checkpoint
MNFASILKQLKKRLRINRRWLFLGSVVLIVGVCAICLSLYGSGSQDSDIQSVMASMSVNKIDPDETVLSMLSEAGDKLDVTTIRTFICGEETEHLGVLTPAEIRNIHSEHPEWVVSRNGTNVVLMEQIDDLSPGCKDTAYFGLDKEDNLSLFDGVPSDKKVIRTFFQLNMGFLESSLQMEAIEELRQGIRVTDMLEYNSVLSTFSEFAVEQ